MTRDGKAIQEQLNKLDEENVTIVLFGQPGSGKSSLINAICGRDAAPVGVETDTTREPLLVEHGDATFIDLPGYGTKSFPWNEFVKKFRIFQYDLFLCVFSDKLHEGDTELFKLLTARGKPCIFVRNKTDLIYEEDRSLQESEGTIRQDVAKQLGREDFELVFVCSRKDCPSGLDALNDAIIRKMPEARREKYILTAEARTKEQLDAKRQAARSYVRRSCTYAAYNGVNPLIGVDAAVDLLILYQMYGCIRESFGITPEVIHSSRKVSLKDKALVLGGMSKEGIKVIIKTLGRRFAARSFLKAVPVVGQAASALLGYQLVRQSGLQYIDACYDLARERLLEELDAKRK